MRKILCAILCIFLFIGCENNANVNNATEPEITTETRNQTEFGNISTMAFIGGSVVYNPDSEQFSQLKAGAEIAFYLNEIDKAAPEVLDGGEATFDTAAVEGIDTSAPESVYSFDDEKVAYGYLRVESVSRDSVKLASSIYSNNGKTKKTESISLKAGDTADLNKDGKADIAYKPLTPVREGFEDAMCLEFIADLNARHAAMYATMEEGMLENTAKAITGYEGLTFYGINSNGDFIYILSEDDFDSETKSITKSSSVLGISHGDYVINAEDGEMFAVIGIVPEDDLTVNEPGANDPFLQYPNEDQITGKNSVSIIKDETADGEYYLYSNEEAVEAQSKGIDADVFNLDEAFTSFYRKNQFASDEGPLALLNRLPKELVSGALEAFETTNPSSEEALDILNFILLTGPVLEEVAEAENLILSETEQKMQDKVIYLFFRSGFRGETLAKLDQLYKDYDEGTIDPDGFEEEFWNIVLSEDIPEGDFNPAETDEEIEIVIESFLEIAKINREYLDNVYRESPESVVEAPDIATVYPMLSLNLGTIDKDALDITDDIETVEKGIGDSKPQTYAEYLKQKKAIDKAFGEFWSMSLSDISISDFEKATDADGKVDSSQLTIEDAIDDEPLDGDVPAPFNLHNEQPFVIKAPGAGMDEDVDEPLDGDVPSPGDNNKPTQISLGKFHLELALGINGRLDHTSGHIESDLACAVYIAGNGNFKEFKQDGIELFKKKLADTDKTFMIGPVPITVGIATVFNASMDALISTNLNFAVGFVGMYGGGAKLSVDYGVRWFVPYIHSSFDAYKICQQTYYFGLAEEVDDSVWTSFNGAYVVAKPGLTLVPSLKLGPKYVYIGVKAPISAKLNIGFGLFGTEYIEHVKEDGSSNPYLSKMLKDKFWVEMPQTTLQEDLGITEFGKLSVGLGARINPVVGVKIPLINKRIEANFSAFNLFNAEIGITENGIGASFSSDFMPKEE